MDVIDYGAWRFWLSAGQMLFNVMIAIYIWNNRKHQATNSRVERLEESLVKRVEDAEKDLLSVKGCVEHLPTQDQIREVSKEMQALSSQMGELRGRITGINRAVDIINEFLINKGERYGG